MDTIPARFVRQATALGRKPLFLVKRAGAYQPISWQQAAEDVVALSCFLLDQQVNAGERVLILAENRPEWCLADLAIQSVGAWSVPVYPSLTPEDVTAICADCQPVLCVASTTEQAQKLLQVMSAVPSIRGLVVMDEAAGAQAQWLTWSQALAKGRAGGAKLKGLLDHRLQALRPDDTATLIYTSGTTGEPKGVMLSHRNFLSNVEACLEVITIRASDLHFILFAPVARL